MSPIPTSLNLPGEGWMDGESTSARLRRVEQERDQANELTDKIAAELRLVTRERDSLARRCAVRFEETQALKAELEQLRPIADAARAYVTFPERPEVTDPNEAHSWDLEAERRYYALKELIQPGGAA